MGASRQGETKHRETWAETKAAVRDYARNPCRATEQKVESAIDHIRRLDGNEPAQPKPKSRPNAR